MNASYNILQAGAAPTVLSEISSHPEDKWGGAVTATLQIKNLPTGAGDDFKIDAIYAKGDTKAVISTSGATPQFLMYSGGLGGGATQGLKLTNAWGVRGAFNHNWDPYWSTSLWGSYASVRYDGSVLDLTSAKGALCAAYIAGTGGLGNKSANFSCNPDFNIAQVGVVTRWTPVKNLTFSAEVGAFFLDQKFTGTSTLSPAAPKPTATYEFKDQSTVFLNVRAQRNF